jgi:arginine exporter protein ArgO
MNSFHQAYTTLKYPTTRRVVKMGTMTVSFIWFLSTLFCMAAYLSLGERLKTVSLFPDREALPGS